MKDEAGYTMMVAETGQATGSWMQGGIATVGELDPANQPYIGPGRTIRLFSLAGYECRGGRWFGRMDRWHGRSQGL